MKGARPLDNDEIRQVASAFTGTFEIRNRGLFMLGVSTGGRIFELLSPRIGENGKLATQKYIGVNYATAREDVEAMAFGAEPYRTALLSGSLKFLGGELKNTADETLFLELALRGYDLSSLRENDETDQTNAEIVKIG